MDNSVLAQVNVFIDKMIGEGVIPGAAVMASRDGEIFYELAAGEVTRSDGKRSAMSLDLRHPMYSFSKGVATTVICDVHARGGFDWDDPVEKHIPGYACKGKEGTLVRHLLSHAAGIPLVFMNVPNGPAWAMLPNGKDWDEALAQVVEAEAMFPPGSASMYHGLSGHFVAACIACKAAGTDFVTLSRDLLDRIGATTMGLEYPTDLSDVAICPVPAGPALLPAPEQFKWQPAGAYFGRPEDMLKVVQLHLDRGRDVIPWTSLGAMHVPQFKAQLDAGQQQYQGWGLGWMLGYKSADIAGSGWFGFGPDTHPNTFTHAGISTTLGVGDPDRGVAIAICLSDGPYDSLGESGAKATEIRVTVTGTILRACG